MNETERLHRPELARDRPIRDFMSYVRNGGAGEPPDPAPRDKGTTDSIDDSVAHGVKLGYSVIEEQMRQGERLAERLRPAQAGARAQPLDFNALIERALNVYKDLGALALAAAETLARTSSLRTDGERASRGAAAADAAPASAGGMQFVLELKSTRRVTVRLDARPRSERFVPHVHALHAMNPGAPPLTSVRFEVDAGSFAPVLRIDIDDALPADAYSGLLVDSATNEPCGTLSVRILS